VPDTYRTLAASATIEIKVEGSRFIGEAVPVGNRAAAEERIAAIQQRERDATHHCTAYRMGVSGDTFRYSDDGEPTGTAGPPLLRQIDARDLTNTLVVVTRYYGGTKLGTGGLARAYGSAAAEALDAAPVAERVIRVPVRIEFAYDDTSAANRLLQPFDVEVVDRDYTDVTRWTVAVRRSEVEAFQDAFVNALADRGTVLQVGDEDAANAAGAS
jgi:uncharacterized YigZ family protein